jgi:hypothetical protein
MADDQVSVVSQEEISKKERKYVCVGKRKKKKREKRKEKCNEKMKYVTF